MLVSREQITNAIYEIESQILSGAPTITSKSFNGVSVSFSVESAKSRLQYLYDWLDALDGKSSINTVSIDLRRSLS